MDASIRIGHVSDAALLMKTTSSYLSLLLILVLGCPKAISAMGGEICAEVSFFLNEKQEHGYVILDYWVASVDPEKFDSIFHAKYDEHPSLEVYSVLKDQKILAQYASFPMHSYELDRDRSKTISPIQMHAIRLHQFWSRDEYHIKVLTPLSLSDTVWIGGATKVYYPTGQEVGCRLEVYVFDHDPDPALVEIMVEHFGRDRPITPLEQERGMAALLALKAKRAVVVELCGC